eukprot:Nitzschia sp. Nitz4//scaffold177_size45885//41470//42855//NITZ4_007214-RA/size45885-processed-gene-0.44-mRNA-1//1//CDS//3329539082//4619//frame0
MAGWRDRARQLRAANSRRRRIPKLGSGESGGAEIGFAPLIVAILILLAIGAGIATTVIHHLNPTCVANPGIEGVSAAGSEGLLRASSSSAESPEVEVEVEQSNEEQVEQSKVEENTANAESDDSSQAAVPSPVDSPSQEEQPNENEEPQEEEATGVAYSDHTQSAGDANIGAACSEEQKDQISKQLTVAGCNAAQYLQGCSITKATAQVCRDSTAYMRKLYAVGVAHLQKDSEEVYTSITVGFADTETSPQDMLYIFSHGTFSRIEKGSCLPDVDFYKNPRHKIGTPQVYLLDYENKGEAYIKELKDQLPELQDHELIRDTTPLNEEMTIAKWADSKLTATKNPVIHFFRLHQPRPDLLMGAKPIWSRILYMEFLYGNKGTWSRYSLENVIQELRDEGGFVCYWQGEGHLWKITDCWQDYFGKYHWSFVVCLNTRNEEGVTMRHQMDAAFQLTLNNKDLIY